MNLKLEAIVVPFSDVDRAKRFYQEALGFRVGVDHRAAVYEEALGFSEFIDLSDVTQHSEEEQKNIF
jgi:catechol 2,3-dioxygenase-like lactoylglutathione lyase family enzyme